MGYIDPLAELEDLRTLGEIRDTPPIECDPFSSQAPFQLDPASFVDDFPSDEELFNVIGTADALVAGTEQGEEVIDFTRPMLEEK